MARTRQTARKVVKTEEQDDVPRVEGAEAVSYTHLRAHET
jgi:hypothetical protein